MLTKIERTTRDMGSSLDGLVECLTFTVESQEDFRDGWLPTLDMNLMVDEENYIQYKFFEKPTTSQLCLQADTTLSQNGLV